MRKVLEFVLSMIIVFGLLGAIIYYVRRVDEQKTKRIHESPAFTNGLVIRKRSYKGKGMDVKYVVGQEEYELVTGVSSALYWKYQIGDSIEVEYLSTDPSTARLKEEKESSDNPDSISVGT